MSVQAESSLKLALADIELLCSAYPDEVVFAGGDFFDESSEHQSADNCAIHQDASSPQHRLPLTVTLHLSDDALMDLQFEDGYPTMSAIKISRYRSSKYNDILEIAVAAVQKTALDCMEDGMEGALACCAAAFEAWNSALDDKLKSAMALQPQSVGRIASEEQSKLSFEWISGEPLVDRKSTFQAHLCLVKSEKEVKSALKELHLISNKISRATHNMWAYRYSSSSNDGRHILYHDNDDDGEDGAGSRLAHLLEMRKDDGVLVVVSRWYGGIHLGPKRFAHIINVARNLLVLSEQTER